MIVGITGISTSGKSTIAKELQKHFGGQILCIDDFYGPENCFPEIEIKELGIKVVNWDSPDAIDWEKFYKKLVELSSKSKIIYVDAFLLCYNEKILNLLNCIIYIKYEDNEIEVATKRRISRITNEQPPENISEKEYFEYVVWPFAQSHKSWFEPAPNFNKPVLNLKATDEILININKSKMFIANFLSSI